MRVVGERGGDRVARRRRNRTSSYSACAMPWAMPPCCWPATSSGLRIRPQSSTATWRTRRDPARSRCRPRRRRRARRTGTSAPSWSKSSRRRRCRRVAAARATSAQVTRRRRARRARRTRPSSVSDDVVDGRLQQVRRHAAGLVEHLVGRRVHGAAAELQRPRAAGAPAARHERGVGLDEADRLHRDAEPVARRASRTPSRGPGRAPTCPRDGGGAVGVHRRPKPNSPPPPAVIST